MQRDFIRRLHCPYSGSPVSLSMANKVEGEDIVYGIVTTEAGDFPIVAGILRLQIDEYRESIVKHVREKRFLEAVSIAFHDVPFHARGGAAINFVSRLAFKAGFSKAGELLTRLNREFSGILTNGQATFIAIAEKLTSAGLADWQIFRFSMPTFLPVYPLLHIVKGDYPILDFGCGTGHAAFLISRMCPNSNVVCADYSFWSLYVAKRYFAPDASYVCLDGNYPLPFESGEFSTIFSSDTLHCLDSKLGLIQEFARVCCATAVMILPHLHNRLVSPYAKSLTPSGYRRLFNGMATRIFPEQEVIRNYFADGVLDLCRDWSEEELASAEQGLSIVASGDPSVFNRREDLWDARIRTFGHARINPAYRVTGGPGNWELTRRASDRYVESFVHKGRVCLPETCKVSAISVDSGGLVELQRTDSAQFAHLARSLVVLDLPERFMTERQECQYGADRLVPRTAV